MIGETVIFISSSDETTLDVVGVSADGTYLLEHPSAEVLKKMAAECRSDVDLAAWFVQVRHDRHPYPRHRFERAVLQPRFVDAVLRWAAKSLLLN